MVPVDTAAAQQQCIDIVLNDCEDGYVAIVPAGFPVRDMWMEDSLYALINTSNDREAFELEGSSPSCWAVVARKDHLHLARSRYRHLPIREGLAAAGISIRRVRSDEIPFQFDSLLQTARAEEKNGNWQGAAKVYEYIGEHYDNQLWMKSLAAEALYKAGNFAGAAELVSWMNQRRPTVNTLFLEAKLKRRNCDLHGALSLLGKAEDILAGEESPDFNTAAVTNTLRKT
jgi:hypothetical protein